ncbi:MAG: hypothetical protein D6707_00370 [Bacteroidetes bacterium]|nr:MAG: hypothetical protein D6707_00370 [Bacteroidota bacterium]
MKNLVIIGGAVILFSACNLGSESEDSAKKSELFGWSSEDTKKLYDGCVKNFNLTVHPPIDTAIYCDCFVNKIITSIHKEKFHKPDDKIVKMESDFSEACIELTRKTMKDKE